MADTDPINLDELIKPSGPAPEAINLDDLGGLPAPPAPPAKSYLSRAGDIPKDIRDMAVGSAKDTAHSLIDPYLKLYHPDSTIYQRLQGLAAIPNVPGEFASGLMGTVMSPLMGPVRSMISRPVEEKTGIPKEITEAGVGLVPTAAGAALRASSAAPALVALGERMGLRRQTVAPERPLPEHLHDASDENYARAAQLPVGFDDHAVANIGQRILTFLRSNPGGAHRAPQMPRTVAELRELMERPGATHPGTGVTDMPDIEAVRKNLGRAAREVDAKGNRTEEAAAASKAMEMLDNELQGMAGRPQDVAYGHAHVPELLQNMEEGRGNWAAYLRTKLLGEEVQKALMGAASTGTGANIENKIRQHFKSLYFSAKGRMFNADERALIGEVANGDMLRNSLRYIGKAAPSGAISTAVGQYLAGLLGGSWARGIVPFAGHIAKKAAESQAHSAAERVAAAAATRSPYYQSLPNVTRIRGYAFPAGASHPLVQKYLGDETQ